MSNFDAEPQLYRKSASDLGNTVDLSLLGSGAKRLGSIYKDDSAFVSATDKEKRDWFKNNFLFKKLRLEDSPKLDAALQVVAQIFGSSNQHKYRALFYYFLVKNLSKESNYA